MTRLTAFAQVLAAAILCGCSPSEGSLTIYCSQDEVYARPILQRFAEQTGIEVRPVFDSEAVKTVGLANRLLAERTHPQANLFWNNEPLRTYQLVALGALEPSVASFGYRSRRLVVNTNLLPLAHAPTDWLDLAKPEWKGKFALAYPLFGSTATHFLALRQKLGEAAWRQWCSDLEANRPLLVDGNSIVVKLVGSGEAVVGMTDSDDIAAGQKEGLPIVSLPLSSNSLLIPNTIGRVKGAPDNPLSEQLAAYLQESATVDALVKSGALEGGQLPAASLVGLQPDWLRLAADIEPATETLREIFLRK